MVVVVVVGMMMLVIVVTQEWTGEKEKQRRIRFGSAPVHFQQKAITSTTEMSKSISSEQVSGSFSKVAQRFVSPWARFSPT